MCCSSVRRPNASDEQMNAMKINITSFRTDLRIHMVFTWKTLSRRLRESIIRSLLGTRRIEVRSHSLHWNSDSALPTNAWNERMRMHASWRREGWFNTWFIDPSMAWLFLAPIHNMHLTAFNPLTAKREKVLIYAKTSWETTQSTFRIPYKRRRAG